MRTLFRLLITALIITPALIAATPASANVSQLTLHRRNCQAVTAYAVYDSFSVGMQPFYVVFQADVDGDGVFGENNEPTSYVPVTSGANRPANVGARLYFEPQPEGTVIAVTAYEVDNAGRQVSAPLASVSYTCANRSALDPIPSPGSTPAANARVTARILVENVQVYDAPSASSTLIGGLGQGQVANVIGRNERGDWVQIEFQGGKGWFMWMTTARMFGPLQKLPVVTE